MLCSAPQPSKATWFSTRPHWPAAPGAGKASPAAPHHLRNSGDQTSHPFTRDCSGQSLPHILLHQHRGAASVCPKQLQLPLCQRCQEWGQPRAQLPAGGLCSWRCLWHRNQCQNTPCPCWGSLCPPHTGVGLQEMCFAGGTRHHQGRGISARAWHIFLSASHFFPSQFHLTPERVQTPPLTWAREFPPKPGPLNPLTEIFF